MCTSPCFRYPSSAIKAPNGRMLTTLPRRIAPGGGTSSESAGRRSLRGRSKSSCGEERRGGERRGIRRPGDGRRRGEREYRGRRSRLSSDDGDRRRCRSCGDGERRRPRRSSRGSSGRSVRRSRPRLADRESDARGSREREDSRLSDIVGLRRATSPALLLHMNIHKVVRTQDDF
eukprot:scaffold2483_cov135-Isochrysis_galbana.AAC.9